MHLKRPDQIEWFDLPRIESPRLARNLLENTLTANGLPAFGVSGLEDVIEDDLNPNRREWNLRALMRLLQKVENGELFLLHDIGVEPLVPAVSRSTARDGANTWRPSTSLDTLTQSGVERMLAYAALTKEVWAPITAPQPVAAPRAEAPTEKSELTVTNPRWEYPERAQGQGAEESAEGDGAVTLKVDVTGVSNGTKVRFNIFDTSVSPPTFIGRAKGEVIDGVGSAEWDAKVPQRQETGSKTGKGTTKLEFDGKVRNVTSERKELPLNPELSFVYPDPSKEHKQYVNIEDNGQDEGINLTLRVKIKKPIEGQTIYWKVTADGNNGKRTEPKVGLKTKPSSSLSELKNGTATCTTTVRKGEAEAILVCGVAGGDKYTVEAGLKDGEYTTKVTVVNWRRLWYKLQAPDFLELDSVTLEGKPAKDYPKKTRDFIDTCLEGVFVEYRLRESLEFKKSESPAGTILPPDYFGLKGKLSRDLHILPPLCKTHPKSFGATQDQTIHVRVCDKSFWWESQYQTAQITINNLNNTGSFLFNVYGAYKKVCLPNDLSHNKPVIDVSSGSWRAVPPAGASTHPGFASGTTPKTGSLAGWTIKNHNQWFIEITPPAGQNSPAQFIGKDSPTTCSVEIELDLTLCFPINGAALRHKQVMVFKKAYPQTMGSTICHELGHSMGMTIMPEGNPTPPGLTPPKHVDELDQGGQPGVYYRNIINKTNDNYGQNGVRGPAHKGPHCATGIADRGTAKDLRGKGGTCVMFGEGSNKEPPSRANFCGVCTSYLKARNLEDIISPWPGRGPSKC